MKIENRKSKIENPQAAFTLLELLVAISILLIIVMMMSGVFFQSRVAWGTGLRRSRLNMEGRAITDFIANELAQAVADPTLQCMIIDGASGLTFYMLDEAAPAHRAVKQVTYAYGGGERRVRRQINYVGFGPYVSSGGATPDAVLARNVRSLNFYTPDGETYRTNLPLYVDVVLQMEQRERVSRVRTGSGGRRGWGFSDDDIWND